MKEKEIFFESDARNRILKGVQTLANAVKSTLGPRGRNVIIDKDRYDPIITKDGITVAKNIVLKDRVAELGVRLLREAASRTNDTAGDGTTTATVLAEAIYTEGIKQLSSGVDPMSLKRGMDKILPLVLQHLTDLSIEVGDDPEKIRQVGIIAANGEKLIGDLIAEALQRVGRDGIITLDEAKGYKTEVELVEGFQFDRGLVNPYFCTDPTTGEAIYNGTDEQPVLIFVSDKRLTQARDVVPVLSIAQQSGSPLLIIADEFSTEVLQVLIVNKIRQGIPVVAVQAPGFGDRKQDLLQDISILTGATLISNNTGILFKDVKREHLGTAKKIVVKRDETIIVEGGGDPEEIKTRAEYIKSEIENLGEAEAAIQREALEGRLAKLTAGIARINAGGASEVEMKERKDRIEDALFATRAAIDEGILPGGGVALFRAAQKINLEELELADDERFGAQILLKALCSPIKQIAQNAGAPVDLVISKLAESSDPYMGYNALTDTYENLVDCGVIDPTKVVRLALENAVSVASTMLTTECVVSCLPDEQSDKNK